MRSNADLIRLRRNRPDVCPAGTPELSLIDSAHMDPKLLEWQKKDLVPLGRFSTPEEQAYMTMLLLDSTMGA
jgi:hypothetical protein